jgi:hypothetical protein
VVSATPEDVVWIATALAALPEGWQRLCDRSDDALSFSLRYCAVDFYARNLLRQAIGTYLLLAISPYLQQAQFLKAACTLHQRAGVTPHEIKQQAPSTRITRNRTRTALPLVDLCWHHFPATWASAAKSKGALRVVEGRQCCSPRVCSVRAVKNKSGKDGTGRAEDTKRRQQIRAKHGDRGANKGDRGESNTAEARGGFC